MSDIDIQFPLWADALILLTWAFWPLTIAAIGAAIWLYVARTSRAAWVIASIIAVAWCISAGTNLFFRIDAARTDAASAAYDRAHQHTLTNDSVVNGMRLPAGTVVVTDDSFRISSLELSKPTALFGVPLKDMVSLRDAKLDGSQTLQRDATVDGLPCSADDGVSFDGGHLTNCRLVHPTTVRGVPCQGYVAIHVNFLGCELATPYHRYNVTWYQGTDVRGNDADLTFTIGSRTSSLRVYGSALSKGTMVVYHDGTIAMVSFITPFHYRGCAITHIERRDGAMTADLESPCSLHPLPNGRVSVPNL